MSRIGEMGARFCAGFDQLENPIGDLEFRRRLMKTQGRFEPSLIFLTAAGFSSILTIIFRVRWNSEPAVMARERYPGA